MCHLYLINVSRASTHCQNDAFTHRSGRKFHERKYRALFQETVRKFLENKVITHNPTEFITPEGDIFDIPIDIQFVNPPPIPEERKIRELANSDEFSEFFDHVLDNAEKELKNRHADDTKH